MKSKITTSNRWELARRNRHTKLLGVLALLVIFTMAAVVYTSITLFSNATREYRTETLEDTAKLAAGIIDGNRVNDWLSGSIDNAYLDTARRLQNILYNTPHLQYLYVYQIRPDGCHVVFDFEPPEDEAEYVEMPDISANVIGEFVAFDESFADYIPTLLAGGQLDVIETNDTFGWLLTKYEPIFDSAGHCVAYVGADISMMGIHEYNTEFGRWVVAISAVFLAGVIVIGYFSSKSTLRADERDEFIERQNRDKRLLREIIEAFARMIDLKDPYTQGHSSRVARYTRMLARELGYDEDTVDQYYNIALMHDIGKIGVPDAVLRKHEGLTDEEFGLIQSHTTKGYDALKNISLMPEIAVGAQSHHERPDGNGYPNHLSGDQIPRVAQIIAVADCFDAMYSNRPYRKRMNFEKAVSIIRDGSGTQLTPDVVDAFLRLVEKGEFRAPDDHGGGSMENIENVRVSE